MGCFKNVAEPKTDAAVSKEYQMAQDIWDFLTEVQGEVDARAQIPAEIHAYSISVGDFKLVLMAIFGVKGNKRLGVPKPPT